MLCLQLQKVEGSLRWELRKAYVERLSIISEGFQGMASWRPSGDSALEVWWGEQLFEMFCTVQGVHPVLSSGCCDCSGAAQLANGMILSSHRSRIFRSYFVLHDTPNLDLINAGPAFGVELVGQLRQYSNRLCSASLEMFDRRVV